MKKPKRKVLGNVKDCQVALQPGKRAVGFAGAAEGDSVEVGTYSFDIEEIKQLSKLLHKAAREASA